MNVNRCCMTLPYPRVLAGLHAGCVGEYTVERMFRDARLLEIGGGTNESHHKNMARDLRRTGDEPLP